MRRIWPCRRISKLFGDTIVHSEVRNMRFDECDHKFDSSLRPRNFVPMVDPKGSSQRSED
uniref:Uncharacterized protein n=1 Tax=Moniliophthora roreri TaxID=221103 RepID=A0A0W0G0Q8_MONRR